MKKLIPKHQGGGYTSTTLDERQRLFNQWDPSGGYDMFNWFLSASNGNKARGEESEYYKAYLGLDNNVPLMNKNAKTSWDDKVEKDKKDKGEFPSDFYGTTPRMDLVIQALADTTNLGKIVRNYDEYKQKNSKLVPKYLVENTYKQAKTLLDNPNTWQQMDADEARIITNPEGESEFNPLGMLAKFGMMWDPENKQIRMHDTYDFSRLARLSTGIPTRPKEMKIRSVIGFDPKKGSVLLKDDLKNYKLPNLINE